MNKQPMEVDEGNMDYLEPCRDIVLHEDKQYYPSAAKIFGADVQTLI
jgi:U5 small nuclear ribonucleoprotein component